MMGRGDQFMRPSFTVPMPAAVETWPFPERGRKFCDTCDQSLAFCQCEKKEEKP